MACEEGSQCQQNLPLAAKVIQVDTPLGALFRPVSGSGSDSLNQQCWSHCSHTPSLATAALSSQGFISVLHTTQILVLRARQS